MDKNKFWEIVGRVRVEAGEDAEARAEALYGELRTLPASDIQEFQHIFGEAMGVAYRWDLWGAAYVMNGGCSDDSFIYFLRWLISEGKPVYEEALVNPDSLASLPRLEYAEVESFGYAAVRAYEEKGRGEIERDFSIELQMPSGEEWEVEDLPSLFPRLAAVYEFEA